MKKFHQRIKRASLRALSGLSINLSAGWFALAFITPNIVDISGALDILRLTYDLLFGILFLVITIFIEFKLNE